MRLVVIRRADGSRHELLVASAGCTGPEQAAEQAEGLRLQVDELAGQGRNLQADLQQASARLGALDAVAAGLGRALSQGLAAVDGRLTGMQADLDSVATHMGTLFRERDQRTSAFKVGENSHRGWVDQGEGHAPPRPLCIVSCRRRAELASRRRRFSPRRGPGQGRAFLSLR